MPPVTLIIKLNYELWNRKKEKLIFKMERNENSSIRANFKDKKRLEYTLYPPPHASRSPSLHFPLRHYTNSIFMVDGRLCTHLQIEDTTVRMTEKLKFFDSIVGFRLSLISLCNSNF